MLELVVARYAEDLSWLRNMPTEITPVVYDKGDSPVAGATSLPNAGREAHTYLHHICERYDDLADVTVFCQGKPFDHAFDFHQVLRDLAARPEEAPAYQWLGHIVDTDSNDGRLFRAWSKNNQREGLDFALFHRLLFGADGPDEYAFYLGGQFAARRELIVQQPRSFYEHARRIALEFSNAAHCFERCWDRVFGIKDASTHVLAGRRTAFLKPIKHQTLLA